MQDHIQTVSRQHGTVSFNQTYIQATRNKTSGVLFGNTATYARYSSENQHATSNADQERVMSQHAQCQGLVIIAECQLRDDSVSGTKRNRQGLNQRLAAADQGRIRVVLFDKLSRISAMWGTGVFDCPYCYGWEVRNQRWAFRASGDQAVE